MEIMRILYKAIFCPILLYGIAIWGWKASGKNMCMKFDRIMRKFCIMSTRCFRSTSNEMLFRLMKTSNFSCLLRQEVLRVALLQLNLFENQSDDVYSRNSMIERSKPLSMEHFFFLCKQGLNKESMNIVYDNLLHFHSVHPAEWVITRTCINDRVKAIWGSVYMMGWIVYTDASVSTYGAGCAIVVYHHGFCVKIQWYALSKCSIFTAETQAVLQAIKYITGIEKIRKEEIIEIRSDAQAVIRALDKTIVTDPALKEVKDELRKTAAKGINILLKWVPSHAGIEGNEIADNYAKQAVDSLVSRDMVLGKKDLKIEIRKMIRDQSRKEWEKYKGNVPKMFFPTVNEFESFSKSSPSVELCQLVTGHCRLNEFMCNKLAVVSSSACACGEGVETVFHYIMECMLYERIRQEVWNDFVPSFEYIRKDWKKVDEFIRKTRRFEYKSIGVS